MPNSEHKQKGRRRTARGQICAFGVNSYVVPPMWKKRLSSFANWAAVIFSRPVVSSSRAPVAFW